MKDEKFYIVSQHASGQKVIEIEEKFRRNIGSIVHGHAQIPRGVNGVGMVSGPKKQCQFVDICRLCVFFRITCVPQKGVSDFLIIIQSP